MQVRLNFRRKQNIQPNRIAGTSAGAIVGAMYAWGKTPDEILDFSSRYICFSGEAFHFLKSRLDRFSESFKEYFHTIFKDATLAELRIPTQITATDMVRVKVARKSTKTPTTFLSR
jgi:NTE family protein